EITPGPLGKGTIQVTNEKIDNSAGVENNLVIVQPDEVLVRSQPGSDKKWVVNYNAVVNTAERKYYFSAATATQSLMQIGSLLATLGLHRGDKRLVVISDCARWIRYWF